MRFFVDVLVCCTSNVFKNCADEERVTRKSGFTIEIIVCIQKTSLQKEVFFSQKLASDQRFRLIKLLCSSDVLIRKLCALRRPSDNIFCFCINQRIKIFHLDFVTDELKISRWKHKHLMLQLFIDLFTVTEDLNFFLHPLSSRLAQFLLSV